MVTNLDKAISDRDSASANVDVLEAELANNAVTPLTEAEVTHLLALTKTYQLDVMDIHKRIIHCSPADLDVHKQEYQKLFMRTTKLLGAYTGLKMAFPVAAPGHTTAMPHASPDIRLPKLELPTFSGDLQEWIAFRDMFVAAVHNNGTLSNSQKLTYLRSQLKGEAARQIANIIISDANYTIAWSQLQHRYQNDRELLFSVLRRFDNQPNVQAHSATAIRQLVDVTRECIRSLDVLKLPTDQWDAIILFYMVKRMDPSSKELWEQSLLTSTIPTLKSLFDFLEQRARALAASGTIAPSSKCTPKPATGQFPNKYNTPPRSMSHYTKNASCSICHESYHPLYKCSKFLGWTPQQRAEAIKKGNNCFNCLKEGHQVSQCPSSSGCKSCNRNHHTLLHRPKPDATSQPREDNPPRAFLTSSPVPNEYDTLLATAVVTVPDRYGQLQNFRVLVDMGSNTHFATVSALNRLKLPMKRCVSSATGLGEASLGTSYGVTKFSVSPHFNSFISFSISRCHIIKRITGNIPSSTFDHNKWPHLQGLQLADPLYHHPEEVDMLLGAEFFFAILEGDKLSGPINSPVAVKTSFGWLIGGGVKDTPLIRPMVHSTLATTNGNNSTAILTSLTPSDHDASLDTILRKFWEIENEPTKRLYTAEETAAVEHFKSTHSRNKDGRFIVHLPRRIPPPPLGSSVKLAMKRLQSLERRLQANPTAKQDYIAFMKEYESMGHMRRLQPHEIESEPHCYIPHHFVLKESSTTTKFRVVFDASARTSSGHSLNDTMLVGPTIQDPLFNILIRFRLHRIAFTADIAKMYRQILVGESDANLQRILWRENPSDVVKHFTLLTVTYGTAPASYLATEAIHELARIEQINFPRASKVTQRDFYVDDLMSGEPSEEEALATQAELLKMMESGSFSLRKWSSNSQALLDSLSPEMRETQTLLNFDIDSTIKTLGIRWNPKDDQFLFQVSTPPNDNKPMTKRTVLSEIAKIFDPIGWLGPIIITAKIFMQSLWKLDQGWDEPLPSDVQQKWSTFQLDLQDLSKLQINRFFLHGTKMSCPSLNTSHLSSSIRICLAGFCDASEKAYAAVIYLCAYDAHGSSSVSLVTSKTRVAPTKVVSLPRLELCGANILSDLMTTVKSSLQVHIHYVHAWTDSTVTLAWIQSHPSRWKTFVANRVTLIQTKIPHSQWSHIPGADNPADCASRGISCGELIDHPLWWQGPSWLSNQPEQWRTPQVQYSRLDEEYIKKEGKEIITCHVTVQDTKSMLDRFSSICKLIRVTAIMLRFIKKCRIPQVSRKREVNQSPPVLSPFLSVSELNCAHDVWIKIIQREAFQYEIKCIKKNIPMQNSRFTSLVPFIDKQGILRVGGRLKNSSLPFSQRNPILLPNRNKFTLMLINYEHIRQFHAGPQLLLSIIQRRYWIHRARDAVRQQIHHCVTCTRAKAQTMQQMMGDLPAHRVNPVRPFLKSGVDYAGPFMIKCIQPRSKITLKAYLAIFVCCVTRAVHLEAVTSLSTDAFLAALRRFISRRGRPSDLYSDCGTNFIGAANEMKEMSKFLGSRSLNQTTADDLSKDGIQWHWNPAGGPHFGGLWEAGVKSVKYHLHRIIGLQRLTFEELATAFTQIEAILNSRPLTPESADPADLSAITPGHFLIGAPLTSIPEPSLEHLQVNRLSRYQLIQQMMQSFWKRWSNEYLTRLQQRPKWMNPKRNIAIGDLVLIKEENLPPLKWKMGRVISVHPGADSLIRVVTLRTSNGELKRPIAKLCLLPVDNPISESLVSTDAAPTDDTQNNHDNIVDLI